MQEIAETDWELAIDAMSQYRILDADDSGVFLF